MKHLLSCLKPYRLEAILSPLFKLLEAAMELIVPLVVAAIIDTGIAGSDKLYVVKMCLVLVGFGAVGLLFSLTAQYFAAKAAVGASENLRKKLFRKLQSFSFSDIDKMGTSTMITRMTSDVNQVQTGVNMTLRLFLRSPFIVFGAMIMAFVLDWRIALIFAVVIPVLAIVVYSVMGASMPLYKNVQEKLDGVYLSTRENLAGVRVIRAFSLEEEEQAGYSEKSEALKKAQKKAGRVAALTNPLTYIFVNLAVIALLYLGAVRVFGGALLKGQVIALYGYLSQILVELIKLANLIVTITKAATCQKRIGAVLNESGEAETLLSTDKEEKGSCPHVQFKNVTFSYAGGGESSLENISFTVNRGETIGILGGTGAGKSTLIGLIPRFYFAEEGEVLINGVNVGAISHVTLRERVGIVPQKAVLFKGTIRSNLLWGKEDATEEELLKAVELAQASDVLAAKGGLDAEIMQEGKNLSGGQRQRLTIARALVRGPEILILDDSSSALDYATDARLRAALRTLDCTVFLVSQRATTVLHADKIVVLDDGKMVGLGTHTELLATSAVYREIYNSQVKEEA